MKFDREALSKKYPEADIDFLIMQLEMKHNFMLYEENVHVNILKPINAKVENAINETINDYLISKEKAFFDKSDKSKKAFIISEINKKLDKIIKEFMVYYEECIIEIYNYQRMYYLWMLEMKYDDTKTYKKPKRVSPNGVVGESDEGDEDSVVSDPGFDDSKKNELLKKKILKKSVSDRTKELKKNVSNEVGNSIDNNIKSTEIGKPKKISTNNIIDKACSSFKRAIDLGIQDADDTCVGDIYAQNQFFNRRFQRVEVLDKRTCLVCAFLDGKTFDNRLGFVHPYCRGIDVPCKLDEKGKVVYREGLRGRRRREDSFQRWFDKKLSVSDRQRVIGKKKYELYKKGDFTLNDLVKGVRVKTLKEVKTDKVLSNHKDVFNSYDNANKLTQKYKKRLKNSNVHSFTNEKEILDYHKYLNRKESMMNLVPSEELKKSGTNRRKVNAEIKRERKVLLDKEREIKKNKKR